MNSERKGFEEWIIKQDWFYDYMGDRSKEDILVFDEETQRYHFLRQQNCWESWQASAQRQGYKLVTVTASKKMLKAGYDAHNDFFFDGQVQDVYKAMIGAVDE